MRALEVAKYVLFMCQQEDNPISNLHLQKILYYVQKGYMKQNNGKALFEDDFVAWKFGPVIEDVYYEYCAYGANKIIIRGECNVKIDKETAKCIDPIIKEKMYLDPWVMVNETHKKGGAWETTFRNGVGRKIIKKELIMSEE